MQHSELGSNKHKYTPHVGHIGNPTSK